MNPYFIALIILWSMSFGLNMARHGKPKEGKENAWTSILAGAINVTLVILAINYGGF